MTNEVVGKHVGTDCPVVCKVTAKDTEESGHPAKTEETIYSAGYLECINAAAELCTLM